MHISGAEAALWKVELAKLDGHASSSAVPFRVQTASRARSDGFTHRDAAQMHHQHLASANTTYHTMAWTPPWPCRRMSVAMPWARADVGGLCEHAYSTRIGHQPRSKIDHLLDEPCKPTDINVRARVGAKPWVAQNVMFCFETTCMLVSPAPPAFQTALQGYALLPSGGSNH